MKNYRWQYETTGFIGASVFVWLRIIAPQRALFKFVLTPVLPGYIPPLSCYCPAQGCWDSVNEASLSSKKTAP